ncbi:MAG: Gfo/Idh/MocA family oxidoreductase [Candidatus Aenigmatarchaeota archaeon]
MKSSKILKLGIIGLGYVGQIHLQHAIRLNNARVIAVADLSKKTLSKAKRYGIQKTFIDYNQMLKDPEIDAVIIALPTHLHLKCAVDAAEAKKHIMLEKPMARNIEEAKEILKTARKNDVKLMIGYPLRFNQQFQNLKRKINDGTLGDIEIAIANYISTGPFFHRAEAHTPIPVPEWWFKKELTGGGALIDLGSHLINLLRWYFGEITDIKSHLGFRFNMDFEDKAICLAKFENRTTAIINVGWFLQGYQLKIELIGTVDHITVQHKPSNPLSTIIQILTTGTSKFYDSHKVELQHFINCLIQDKIPSPSGEDGLKDLEAIAKAYRNQVLLK